jgi:hypothetical protein
MELRTPCIFVSLFILSNAAFAENISDNWTCENETVNISITVHNNGNEVGNGTINFYDGDVFIGDDFVVIGPQSAVNASVNWTAYPVGWHNLIISVDSPGDLDPTNNLANRSFYVYDNQTCYSTTTTTTIILVPVTTRPSGGGGGGGGQTTRASTTSTTTTVITTTTLINVMTTMPVQEEEPADGDNNKVIIGVALIIGFILLWTQRENL